MKLYVIGNGFDLAHGLKTRYRDYLEYIKSNISSQPKWKIILDFYPSNYEFWSDAEKNICKINPGIFRVLDDMDILNMDLLLDEIKKSFANFILSANDFENVPKKFIIDSDALFLSFNYTTTLEDLYGVDPSHIIHIHNSVKDIILNNWLNVSVDEIVLGHSDTPEYYFFYSDNIIGSNKKYIDFREKTKKNVEKKYNAMEFKKEDYCKL